jgi:hypothetical protein
MEPPSFKRAAWHKAGLHSAHVAGLKRAARNKAGLQSVQVAGRRFSHHNTIGRVEHLRDAWRHDAEHQWRRNLAA